MSQPHDLQRGDILGPYRIERRLGAGGMAVVYLAEDTALTRIVALKVLDPAVADEEGRARFVREARALGRIEHEHVVEVYAAGQDGGTAWMALEYIDGDPLDALLVAGPLDEEAALTLVAQVARGLAAVHRADIVHRDVKPQNLLLDSQGVVRIADFGIAMLSGEPGAGGFVTQAGVAVGTPHFMAPEQARGDTVQATTDAWGLGCTAYMLLTGHPPFFTDAEESDAAILARVLRDDVPDIRARAPALSVGAADAVRALLQKDAAARPQDLDALADALDDALDGAPWVSETLASPRPSLTERAAPAAPASLAASPGSRAAAEGGAPPPRIGALVAAVAAALIIGAIAFVVTTRAPLPDPSRGSTVGTDVGAPIAVADTGEGRALARPPAPSAPLRLMGEGALELRPPSVDDGPGFAGTLSVVELSAAARRGEDDALRMLLAQNDDASRRAVRTLAQDPGRAGDVLAAIAKARAHGHFGALQAAARDGDPDLGRAALHAAAALRTVKAHALLEEMSENHPDARLRAAATEAKAAIFSLTP